MSHLDAEAPHCQDSSGPLIRLITPRAKDLGGFSVRRVLPARDQQMIGPFIFVDEMGPAEFEAGHGINVRPHPHIGLATVTYLFDGEILHRDSLGYVQPIQPGAVNLMTAGQGIVHSERTAPEREHNGQRLHGMQIWMALPDDAQECAPSFDHYPASALPVDESAGTRVTLVLGNAFGLSSPVSTQGEVIYAELQLVAGAELALPEGVSERGVYVVSGEIEIGDCVVPAQSMGVLLPGAARCRARRDARVMFFGGEPVGARLIWWNFVHKDAARIEQAKRDWRAGRFASVPGDEEYIPLPELPG
jgi:redox-sensitive bicupin YhaK (pirin superfamily)